MHLWNSEEHQLINYIWLQFLVTSKGFTDHRKTGRVDWVPKGECEEANHGPMIRFTIRVNLTWKSESELKIIEIKVNDGQCLSTCLLHHTQSRPPQARPERWWWSPPPTRSPPSPPSPTRQWPPGSWRGGWGGWWARWRPSWGCARRRTPRGVTMEKGTRTREGGWWQGCICICIFLMLCDSRLVAVLSFMRRVLTRVIRPPTLLKAAMQALALAHIKLGGLEGEVKQSNTDLYCDV